IAHESLAHRAGLAILLDHELKIRECLSILVRYLELGESGKDLDSARRKILQRFGAGGTLDLVEVVVIEKIAILVFRNGRRLHDVTHDDVVTGTLALADRNRLFQE